MIQETIDRRSGSFAPFGWAFPCVENDNEIVTDNVQGMAENGVKFRLDQSSSADHPVGIEEIYLALEQLYLDIEPDAEPGKT